MTGVQTCALPICTDSGYRAVGDRAASVIGAIPAHGPVATSIVHNRVDYAGAMTDGRTAPELDPKGKAACEIAELWKYVDTQLRKHVKGAA